MMKRTDFTKNLFLELLDMEVHRLWLIAGSTLAGAAVAYLVAVALITPQYEASATLYVHTDHRGNSKCVGTYSVIIQSDTVLSQVAKQSELGYTAAQLAEMVTVAAVDGTEVLQITISNTNPEHAQSLANTFLSVAPGELIRVVKATAVETVSEAALPVEPISPNYPLHMLIGAIAGLLVSAGMVSLKAVLLHL